MMSKAPIMPLFTDALVADTTHLSAEEFGAYLPLLVATWRNNGQPFDDNDARLARICRSPVKRWRQRLRPALVDFFDLSDGKWRQRRLEKEWIMVQNRVAMARANGSRGGRPKSLNSNKTGNPTGSFPVNPEHIPEESYPYPYPYPYPNPERDTSVSLSARGREREQTRISSD